MSDFQLNKNINPFLRFENYLNRIYSPKFTNDDHRGYLISLENFKKIKKKYENENNDIISLSNSEESFKIKQIDFKTSKYLLNMIYNDNKFILIDTNLWKEICEKGKEKEEPFIYTIISTDLILMLKDNEELFFKNQKNNIIDISSYSYNFKTNDNFNQLKKIFEDIKNYKNFESKIINDLKKEENSSYNYGYLVSKKWIDQWKKISKYDQITYYIDVKSSEHDIINQLILMEEKEKLVDKYNKLNPIKIISFNNKQELLSFLENDSLVIINYNFINSFKNENPFSTQYKAQNKKIHIGFRKDDFIIPSTNNILSLNKNNEKNHFTILNENNKKHLIQLINIYYFQEELKEKSKLFHPSLSSEKVVYLINKQNIKKYKEFYEYNKLKKILKNNEILKNYNYSNYKENISEIISNLDEDYIKIINQKKIH